MTALLASFAGTPLAACPCITQWTRMVLFHSVTSWRTYLVRPASTWDSFLPTAPPIAPQPLCRWANMVGACQSSSGHCRLRVPLSLHFSRPHRMCPACVLRAQLLLAMTGTACLHSSILHQPALPSVYPLTKPPLQTGAETLADWVEVPPGSFVSGGRNPKLQQVDIWPVLLAPATCSTCTFQRCQQELSHLAMPCCSSH